MSPVMLLKFGQASEAPSFDIFIQLGEIADL